MADAVELREFFEKVLSRHFEYHPDEFDEEYDKFTPSPPPPPAPPPPPPAPVDTQSSVPSNPVTNG